MRRRELLARHEELEAKVKELQREMDILAARVRTVEARNPQWTYMPYVSGTWWAVPAEQCTCGITAICPIHRQRLTPFEVELTEPGFA